MLEDIRKDALKLTLYYHNAQPEDSLPPNVDAFREDADIHLASILTNERNAIAFIREFNDQADTLIKSVTEKLRNTLPPRWDGKDAEPLNYTDSSSLSQSVPLMLDWKFRNIENRLIPGISAVANNRVSFGWTEAGRFLVCEKDKEQEYGKAIQEAIDGENNVQVLRQLKKLEKNARTELQKFTSGVIRINGNVMSGIPLDGECDTYRKQKGTFT